MSDTLGVGITFHVDQEEQGLKKVLSTSQGRVDFLAEQVTFKIYLPNRKLRVQASRPLTKSLTICTMLKKWPQASKRRELLTQKDKLEFKFFSSPVVLHAILHVCQKTKAPCAELKYIIKTWINCVLVFWKMTSLYVFIVQGKNNNAFFLVQYS